MTKPIHQEENPRKPESDQLKVHPRELHQLKLGNVVTQAVATASQPITTQLSTLTDKVSNQQEEIENSIKANLEPFIKSLKKLEDTTSDLTAKAKTANDKIAKLEEDVLNQDQSKRNNNFILIFSLYIKFADATEELYQLHHKPSYVM